MKSSLTFCRKLDEAIETPDNGATVVCDGVSTSAKITKTNPLAENVNKNDKIEKRTGVLGRKRSCHLPVKQFSRGLNYRKKGRISKIKKVADLGRKRSWLIV